MDNERLVFEPGNVWGSDVKTAPFFTIPGWWRRFLFQVLSPRNFAVYAYVVSVCDKNGIAYPAPEQIASDMKVKSRVIVNRAIDDVVELGFLLRTEARVKIRRGMKRTVFQRPKPSYTLLHLLERGLINGELFPADVSEEARDQDFSQSAVELGLKNLLGKELYSHYQNAADKTAALRGLLEFETRALRK